jgi:replication fork clamp-binding protein CrfC
MKEEIEHTPVTAETYLKSFGMGFEEDERFSDCDYSWDSVVSWMEEYASLKVKSLEQSNKQLVEALTDCSERMQRAQTILRDDNGVHDSWLMLDTTIAKSLLKTINENNL